MTLPWMQQHEHPATWLSEEPDADYDPPEDLVRLLADSECGKHDASRMHQCAVGFQPGTMHVQMAKRARTSISADSGEHSSGHSTANVAGPEQTFSYPGENVYDSVAGVQHAQLSHDQAGGRAGAHGASALFVAATLAVQPQEQQQRSQTNKCRPDVLRIQLQMLIEQAECAERELASIQGCVDSSSTPAGKAAGAPAMPPPDVMDAVAAATRIIAELMQMGAKLGLPMAPESKAPTSSLNPHTPGACPSGPKTNMVAEVAATALAASKGNPAAAIMDLLHRVVKRKLAGLRALQASCTAASLAGTHSTDQPKPPPPVPVHGDMPLPARDFYGGQHDDGYDAMAFVHHDHNTTLGMLRATGKRNSSGMVCLGGTSPHARTPAKNEGSLVLPSTPFSGHPPLSVGPGSAGSASLPRRSSGACAAGFATWPGASTPSRSLLRAPGHPTPDSSHPTNDNSARDVAHARTMQHPRLGLEAGAVGLHPMPGHMPLLSSEMDPLSPSHSAPPAFLEMAYPDGLFSQVNGLNGGGPVAHGGYAPVSAMARAKHGRLGYDFSRGLDECDPNMLVDGAPFPMPDGARSVHSCSSLPAHHLVPFPSLRPVRVSHHASPFRPPMPPPPSEVDPLAASSAPLMSYGMHEAAAQQQQQQQPSTVFTAASSIYSAYKGRHSQPGHTSQPLPYPNPSTPLSSMPQQLFSISSPHHFPAQYSNRPSPAMRQQPYYSQTRMELAEATPTKPKSAGQLQYMQPPTPRQPPVSMPHFGGQLLHGALLRANAAPTVACSSMPEATSLQDGDVDCVMDGMLHGDNYLSW